MSERPMGTFAQTQVRVEHWKLEKWETTPKPSQNAVLRAMRYVLPIRPPQPDAIMEGGDDKETIEYVPERPTWWEFTKEHYPRIRAAVRWVLKMYAALRSLSWH